MEENNIQLLKEELRNKIRLLKEEKFGNNKNLNLYLQLSNKIFNKISKFKQFNSSSNIAFFASKQQTFEPETDKLIDLSLNEEKTVYLPRCISNTNEMDFLEINNLINDTEIAAFQLREPKKNIIANNQEEIIKKLNIIFVPGMAFDTVGNRLGYGSGYYDNFLYKLKKWNKNCIIIGITFDFQIFSHEIPHNKRDIKVDYIITPVKIYKIQN